MQPIYNINHAFISDLLNKTTMALDAAVSDSTLKILKDFYPHKVLDTEFRQAITRESIQRMIETCLQASLEREEGKFNNFSIVLVQPDPEFRLEQFVFAEPIPFDATTIKKLSPAISPAKYKIGVWPDAEGTLRIWGYKTNLIWFLTINSISPGKISYSCLSNATTSFKCLISHSQTGVINPFESNINPIAKWISESTRGITSWNKLNDLNQVLALMFQMGEGGAVLLVKNNEEWKSAIRSPILYKIQGPNLSDQFPQIKKRNEVWQEISHNADKNTQLSSTEKLAFQNKVGLATVEARLALENIANLTRVDGATIVDEDHTVVAFGAKIETDGTTLSEVIVKEPFEVDAHPLPIAQIGGTRHQSAAHFVFQQRDSLAVVVSEDRRISVFSWDQDREAVVQLKNIEFLILG